MSIAIDPLLWTHATAALAKRTSSTHDFSLSLKTPAVPWVSASSSLPLWLHVYRTSTHISQDYVESPIRLQVLADIVPHCLDTATVNKWSMKEVIRFTYEYSSVPVPMMRIPSMKFITCWLSWGSASVIPWSLAAAESRRSRDACISSIRLGMTRSRFRPVL